MTARILDGRAIASEIEDNIKAAIEQRNKKGLPQPGLEVILVGDNTASSVYVKHKRKACKKVGIRSHLHQLPDDTTHDELAALIKQCNDDPKTHGILLQLPLPEHIESNNLLEMIKPEKDVDGFHPYNLGRLAQRRPLLRPCTPLGIMKLLEQTKIPLEGQHAVVVSASNIVGRPMALELLLGKCTVTVCHKFTRDLAYHAKHADIIISAIGKPDIVKSEWIKPGATVIDVGIHRLPNGKIAGDIEFETASERAGWISPVPGGVGPMTVAMLLQNTLFAADHQ